MIRKLIRRCGIALSILCIITLILAVSGLLPTVHYTYFHQTGIRWLAEGAVAGLLLAAIGYWENE